MTNDSNPIKKLDATDNTELNKPKTNYSNNQRRKPVSICNRMKGKVDVNEIKKHQANFKHCHLSSLELAKAIQAGNAFSSQFEGARKSENFVCIGFIAIDFDKGETIENILANEFIRQHASFLYTTPSHRVGNNGDRFRIVFELETAISDGTIVTNLVKAILSKYPQADQSCKDPNRIFFGSLDCEIYHIGKILSDEEVSRIIASIRSEDVKAQDDDFVKIKSSLTTDDIREMLTHIDPMPSYPVWRDIVWSVKSWGTQNFVSDQVCKRIIEEWSPDYKTKGAEINKLLREYEHGLISIGTLIFFAKNKGYDVPKKFTKPRTPGQAVVEDLFYDSKLYAAINGELCKYNSGIYEPLSSSVLEQRVGKYFDNYITDFKTGKTGYATKASIQDAINYAKTWFYKDPETINPPGLNLSNGYLKLSYQKDDNPIWALLPHSPENIFTYIADFAYDPEVDSDIFDQAINNILDKKEQEILFRSIAASFDLPEVRKRQGRAVRILLLYGDGSNGKDTVREWLYTLYGQKGITSIPLQAFRQADSSRSFGIYDIASSRINWSSENAAVSLDNCQTLKNCMTGDPIYIEKKMLQGHSVKVKSVFFFNVNQLPRLEAKQEAIASRYGILYFQNTFKSNPDLSDPRQIKADPKLKDDVDYILKNIMPSLLNRLIVSYKDLLKHGIDYSTCKALLQDIRERNDHFAEFLAEYPMIECDLKQCTGTGAKAIYDKYLIWCEQSGLYEVDDHNRKIWNDPSPYDRLIRSEVKITHKLLEYFPRLDRRRSNGKRFLGIKFLLED